MAENYRLAGLRATTRGMRATGFLKSAVAFSLLSILAHAANGQTRYASSDNMSGYVHWIDLYDSNNTRIDPAAENPQPYSPSKTCGRCHDYESIAHGWHFNSIDADAEHGRPGQPWVWSDERTGTHLPLSYRGWKGTHDPGALGLTRWQVAAKLSGYMPGGGVGSEESLAEKLAAESLVAEGSEDRTSVTGEVPVDCMLCHRNAGSGYSPFVWTEQIEDENFAYAPTAALGLGTVSGNMARLKEDFDPKAEDAASQLPKLTYEASQFRSDGKVFFDLVRKPKNDSCYYCHTNVDNDAVTGSRWLHDEDVHVQAGIACADCHRNSIDHLTVRGFDGEQHPAGASIASLSCQGCHMEQSAAPEPEFDSEFALSGRLGAPIPAHRGLPPLHFEKMTCTACHSGPVPSQIVGRHMNSITHRLGEHVKRTGEELPGIVGPVNLPVSFEIAAVGGQAGESGEAEAELSKKYTPHQLMWPSFWGLLKDDGEVQVLNPESVYAAVRKPLKVRRDFSEELSSVKLSLTERKALLGDDRARVKEEEWTPEESQKVAEAEATARTAQIAERMAASLAAIEEAAAALSGDENVANVRAIYVSGGQGFVRKGDAEIEMLDANQLGAAAEPYAWPMAHNVRPARQSWGATGCLECHSDDAEFFNAEITPVGVLPGQTPVAIKVHELHDTDMVRLSAWAQLFAGRSLFKIAGLIVLGLTCLLTVAAVAINVSRFWKHG